jgi:hypothetical protein
MEIGIHGRVPGGLFHASTHHPVGAAPAITLKGLQTATQQQRKRLTGVARHHFYQCADN